MGQYVILYGQSASPIGVLCLGNFTQPAAELGALKSHSSAIVKPDAIANLLK